MRFFYVLRRFPGCSGFPRNEGPETGKLECGVVLHDKINKAASENGLQQRLSLLVLDPDLHRRAAISATLDRIGHYAVPLESLKELIDHPAVPDYVLVADGSDLVRYIARFYSKFGLTPPIIAYSDEIVLRQLVKAVREGASGYLRYPFGRAEFERALEDISLDRPESAPEKKGDSIELGGAPQAKGRRLTPRETEVLGMVAEGMSNVQIAQTLQISRRTVEVHRYNILSKLNARNSIEASNIARRLQLI